jgi:hypothetical protein
MALDLDALATRSEGDDRIPISLSSEAPVERSFGTEILDHTPESVDLTYAREGLPFLVNHDTDRQVGLIEDVGLRSDGRLIGHVRFSKSALGQEIRQDMLDGIRRNISVGYRVDRLTKDTARGEDVYRAAWTPMEGSTVPVPADINVGVGRDAGGAAYPVEVIAPAQPTAPKAETMERTMSDTTPGAAPTVNTGPSAEAIKRDVLEIVNLAREHDMTDKVDGWLSRSMSPEAVAKEILALKRATVKPVETPAGHVDLTPREHQRTTSPARSTWSPTPRRARAVRGPRAGSVRRDREAHGQGAPGGLWVPMNVQKPFVDAPARASPARRPGTSSLGGAGVQTTS